MAQASRRPALRIEHQKSKALSAGRRVRPGSGEIFSPTQFGFCLLLPAILVANRSPSLNDLDVMMQYQPIR